MSNELVPTLERTRCGGTRWPYGPGCLFYPGSNQGKRMKYRKGDSVVDAVQFDPHVQPWPAGVIPWSQAGYQPRDMSWGYVQLADGRKHVQYGDWIITDETGGKHVCPDGVFRSEYEPVRAEMTDEHVREIIREELDKWMQKLFLSIRAQGVRM